MSCSCINCYVDEESGYILVIEEPLRIETNECMCCECWKIIEPYEAHELFVGISRRYTDFDEKIFPGAPKSTHRTCLSCVSLRDEFFCDGWFFGDIIEDIETHIEDIGGEIPESCLSRLSDEARMHLVELIDYYIDHCEE